MPTPLSKYKEIIDNYCIVYRGSNENHIKQLIEVRPKLETKFNLNVFVCIHDRYSDIASSEQRVILLDHLKETTKEYAHIREIKDNLINDPIADFLSECKLEKF